MVLVAAAAAFVNGHCEWGGFEQRDGGTYEP